MAQSESQARQRLVAAAADLLSRRGLTATSIRELAKHAKAPLGSTYHYFPGGKQQVTEEALQFVGERIEKALIKAFQAGPLIGLSNFLNLWRDQVTKSYFKAGCPVVSVATAELDEEEGARLLDLSAKVFSSWEVVLQQSMLQHGLSEPQAKGLATLSLAAVEGAVALCRAKRSIQPLETVAEQLEFILRDALANPQPEG